MGLRTYARIGFAHHMLYPGSISDAEECVRTLVPFVARADIETFDACVPFGELRAKCVAAIRESGKRDVGYAAIHFPLRKISLGSTNRQEQELSKLILADQIEQAIAVGARYFNFASGFDLPTERKAARQAFADVTVWICERLAKAGMVGLIEPFDRETDKKFLLGPSSECMELVENVRRRVDNIGFCVDMAHVPLMGETFEQALRLTAPYIRRLHIGNCVLKNRDDRFFGDSHVPMGYPGGEHDVPDLARFLQQAMDLGLLTPRREISVLFETRPFPDQTPEQTIADQFARLEQAWKLVQPRSATGKKA